jgi:hypothetical protein
MLFIVFFLKKASSKERKKNLKKKIIIKKCGLFWVQDGQYIIFFALTLVCFGLTF